MSGDADPPRELLVATRNAGKAAELRALLARLAARIVDLRQAGVSYHPDEDAIEDADTFEANALAKARYFCARSGGRPVVADDSGLCVAALGGAPGVRSRRYSGAAGTDADVSLPNSARLLRELANVSDRRAEFVCAVAYIDETREVVCTGKTSGSILLEPRGSAGFGYDPLFWSDQLGRGFGEATDAEKARVSHRARAIGELLLRLRASDDAPTADDLGR
ncbi:non-canonical purine NTP pyrophosphatase [Gemmatimonadetes bacterium T265]|nr:non-canonical purine NTP pyrophosphatase [Gemmatimonadetes bacterium T265]